MRFAASSVILAGLAVVKAQTPSISSQCQSALIGIAGSPDAQCLNVGGLISVFTTPQNESLLQPAVNWLEGACAADPCTNDQLASIATNITTGCSSDLSGLGFSNDSLPDVISNIQQFYPTVRSVACLKDTTNNTLCLDTQLTQVQNAVGPLTVQNIVQTIPNILSGNTNVSGLASSLACSDCNKAAYNIIASQQPSLQSTLQSTLQSECGASFVDGSTPTQIVQGTGTAAPSSSNSNVNGASVFVPHLTVGVAVTIASAFLSAVLL